MFIFVDLLGWKDVIIKYASNILVIILNYVASKFMVFGREDMMIVKIRNIVKDKKVYIMFCFIFFLFMMALNLLHSAPWGDEWVEYYYSQTAIRTGDLYNRIIGTFQPPLYNFLMHFWLKMDQTILWFRLFNVFIGCVAGLFLLLTTRKLYNEKIAASSLCFLAICYQWIYCIQECSEYALMLVCLFGALYFYVSCNEKFSYLKMGMVITCSVLAIYSQYGSVFVALPLLCVFWVGVIFNKREQLKKKIILTISYVVSFVIFAYPLYYFFLSRQLENNAISENTVKFTGDLIKDIPFVIGRILGYLFNINSGDVWPLLLSVVGLLVIAASFIICTKKQIEWSKRSLVIIFLIAYFTHYFLVQLHIYAMVHPGQSMGFYARYSYFYIPLLCITLPILILENKEAILSCAKWKKYAACLLIASISVTSFIGVIGNWNKAYDDQFAKIWLENEGWNEITYLYGVKYGFYYYIKNSDDYEESYLTNVMETVDNDKLPESFWAWRTNWDGDGWQTTIDKAKELGYNITIYEDSGYAGQLAYCTLSSE